MHSESAQQLNGKFNAKVDKRLEIDLAVKLHQKRNNKDDRKKICINKSNNSILTKQPLEKQHNAIQYNNITN